MIDVACLIHGETYDWQYVDRLYSMVSRNVNQPITMHVYTEKQRPVPAPYVKHELLDWGFGGPKKAWWYKLQLFNPLYHHGPMLYFDLDTVIVNDISWIIKLDTDVFWSVRDFKYLWKPHLYNVNSSVMWWDTSKFSDIWHRACDQDIPIIMRRHHGDQDFLSETIEQSRRRCFDPDKIRSWRWQCLDGGFDFASRRYFRPGTGTRFDEDVSVLIFHGSPKPSEVRDPVIGQHWQ